MHKKNSDHMSNLQEEIRQAGWKLLKDRQKNRFEHKPMSKQKQIFLISFAAILMAHSSHYFKYANNFVIGGVEGLSIILSRYIPTTPAIITFVINIILLVIAFFVIGRKFTLRTGYVAILNSITAIALDKIAPLATTLTQNKLLELIFAVILSALGSAILFYLSASSGGTDIVAMILKKYTNMDIGKSLLAVDSTLTIISFSIFGIEIGLLSCLGLIMKGIFLDLIIESFNTAKFFIIISSKQEELGSFIKHNLNRSATMLDGKGLYKGRELTIFLCVTNKYEAVLFRNFIKKADPNCFITEIKTSSIIGKGFYFNNGE
ncbi:MAG: YitT family protein [Tissierellia bacterium]|nr:YitT family protein [Tissierellia bacterium]